MKYTVMSRGGLLLRSGEAETLGALLESHVSSGGSLHWADLAGATLARATLTGADLAGADLAGADLTGATLTGADLTGADLTGVTLTGATLARATLARATLTWADLTGATLTGADLTGADLTGATLTGATLARVTLTGADLTGADLTGADLTGADLTWVTLTGADLTGVTLTGADLTWVTLARAALANIQQDIWRILSAYPDDVPFLRQALVAGRIDGSAYKGPCACLVGTLAAARGCAYDAMPGLPPDPGCPAERWFLGIDPGDTPDNSQVAAMTLGWIDAWLATQSQETPQ